MERKILHLCILLIFSLANSKEICHPQNRTDFISSHLSQDCVSSLTSQAFQLPIQPDEMFKPSESSLTVMCQDNCAGLYSQWLQNECGDQYSARMIEVMCIKTHGTSSAGPRCRYLFPDAYDGSQIVPTILSHCGLIIFNPSVCAEGCNQNLNDLIRKFGCCYESMVNNREFVISLRNVGFINDTIANATIDFAQSPVWKSCDITVPKKCELLGSSSPSMHHLLNNIRFAAIFLFIAVFIF